MSVFKLENLENCRKRIETGEFSRVCSTYAHRQTYYALFARRREKITVVGAMACTRVKHGGPPKPKPYKLQKAKKKFTYRHHGQRDLGHQENSHDDDQH